MRLLRRRYASPRNDSCTESIALHPLRYNLAVMTSDFSPDAFPEGALRVKALLFDFDGLILDTETPDVHAWENIYAEYGFPFPLESWAQIIGGTGGSTFDAAVHLQSLLSDPLDLEALQLRQNDISHSLVDQQSIMPGVMDYLHEAKR